MVEAPGRLDVDLGLRRPPRQPWLAARPRMAAAPLKIIWMEGRLPDDELITSLAPSVIRTGRIDSHERLRAPRASQGRRLPTPSSARSVGEAKTNERDVQVLSCDLPLHLAENAGDVVSRANDTLTLAVAASNESFAGFAALPWRDPVAALGELNRVASGHSLSGVMLVGAPTDDSFIDDPVFRPVLARIAELRMPLHIHPSAPRSPVQQAYYAGFAGEVSARLSLFGWGAHNEAGVQTLRLILSGALDRWPDLTLVSGHWGEMIPFFLQRLDDLMPPSLTGLRRTISESYRDQVYVTPSGMFHAGQFRLCRDLLGAERILFSTGPAHSSLEACDWLRSLPIRDREKEAIAHCNAERLLRL